MIEALEIMECILDYLGGPNAVRILKIGRQPSQREGHVWTEADAVVMDLEDRERDHESRNVTGL